MAAEHKIVFNIGSVFSKEGFTRAETAVKTTADKAKKATTALSQVSGQMSEVGGAAGKMVGAVGNVVGSFKEVGAAGGFAALGMVGMNLVLDQMRQELDKMVKWAKDAADAQEKAANKAFAEHLERVVKALRDSRDVAKDVAKEFDLVAAGQAKIAAAGAGVATSSSNQKIAKMEWQAALERSGLSDESDKKLSEAKWKLAVQIEKAAQDTETAAAGEEAAQRALDHARDRQALATDSLTQLQAALAVAEAEEALARKANREKAKPFTEKRIEIQKSLHDAELEVLGATDDLSAAEKNLAKAALDAESVRLRGQTETVGLEEAERELKRQTEEESKAKAEKLRQQAESEQTVTDLRRQQSEAEDRGNALLDEIDGDIRKQTRLVAEIAHTQEESRRGMAVDAASTTGSFGQYVYHVDSAGNINDFEDFQRAGRYDKGRGANERRTQARNEERYERNMYDLLAKRDSGKYMSDSDKRRLGQLIEFDAQRKEAGAEQRKLDALKAERDQAQKKLETDVSEIRKNIEKCLAVK